MRFIRTIAAAGLAAALPAALQAQNAPRAAPAAAPRPMPAPAALAEARQLVAIIYPPETRMRTFSGPIVSVANRMRQFAQTRITDAGLRKIVETRAAGVEARLAPALQSSLPSLIEALAVAYAREFSIPELQQARTFASSPGGKHFMQRAGTITSDPGVVAVDRAYGANVAQMAKAESDALNAELNAYLEKHPEARPKTPAPAAKPPAGKP